VKMKKSALGLLLVLVLIVSACGVSSSAPEGTMEKTTATSEAMLDEAGTDDEMMQAATPTGEAMLDEAGTEDEEMSGDEMPQDEEMAVDEAMAAPAWYAIELTDVNAGQTFRVTDFAGKVVLVETMAVWCPTCLRQQREMQALHQALGEQDDLISISLDIDPNENADVLKAHAGKNGLDWRFAVAPREVAREIGQLYGEQFLNPPSAPVLIIDRQGQAHPLPLGVKSAQTLQEALSPYLN